MTAVKPRILKQIKLLQTEGKDKGLSVQYDQQNLEHIVISLVGPEGTLYEGGLFFIDLQLTSFPWKAPKCHFKTPIYNPVIQNTGLLHCCFDFGEQWSPAINILKIVNKYMSYFYVQNLNSNSCFGNNEIHNQFLHNNQQFRRKAKQWTKKYAMRESTYNNVLDLLQEGENIQILNLNGRNYNCLLLPVQDNQCIKLSKAYLPNLKSLKINLEKVTDVGCSELFQPKTWPKLTQLSLMSNGKVKQSIKYLQIPYWNNLKVLEIQNINGGSYKIKSLIKCYWPQLNSFQLNLSYLTIQMIQIFVKANWVQLQKLSFGYSSNLSPIGIFRLFTTNYKCLKQLKVNIGFKSYQSSRLFKDQLHKLLNIPQKI